MTLDILTLLPAREGEKEWSAWRAVREIKKHSKHNLTLRNGRFVEKGDEDYDLIFFRVPPREEFDYDSSLFRGFLPEVVFYMGSRRVADWTPSGVEEKAGKVMVQHPPIAEPLPKETDVKILPPGLNIDLFPLKDELPEGTVGWVGDKRTPPNNFKLLTKSIPGSVRFLVQDGSPKSPEPSIPYDKMYKIFHKMRLYATVAEPGRGQLPVLEALSTGTPVIATPNGWSDMGVLDDENSVIVESANEISSAIEELIDDDDRIRKMGESGRKKIIEESDWKKRIKLFDECFEEVAS